MRTTTRSWIILLVSILLVVAAASFVVVAMFRVWHRPRPEQSMCTTDANYANAQYKKLMNLTSTQQQFFGADPLNDRNTVVHLCIQAEVRAYIDSDYGEIKDMAKAFLTLITAVFIASITFSEKIIDLKTAPRAAAVSMFMCWILLLFAIFTCGIGLAMNLSSLFDLKYLWADPWYTELKGIQLFFISGTAFALGLTTMLIAALPIHMAVPVLEVTNSPQDESEDTTAS